MGEHTRKGGSPHQGRPGTLGELIHEAVRRTIELAVEEELTAALGACPFRLTDPGVRRAGCGRSSGAPGLGSEGHPAWTHVFRVEFQTHGGGRPRRTALTDRPATSAWRVHPPRRPEGSYAAWRV
jgi:hypothetical protein